MVIRNIIITLLSIFMLINVSSAEEVPATAGNGSEDWKYEKKYLYEQRDNFIKEYGDLEIKEFRITGNTKTRAWTILREIHADTGKPLSFFDCYHTVNSLKKKNLFSSIELKYAPAGGGVAVEIHIAEKWTIIPIPLFNSNGNKLSAGLYILETNFLGFGTTIFTGGSISTAGNSAIFGFVDPALLGSNARLNLFFSYKKIIYETGDMEENLFNEYRSVSRLARIDAGWSFPLGISAYLSGGYRESVIDSGYGNTSNAPDSAKICPLGILFNIDRLYHYEYLYYGLKLDSGWYHGFNAHDEGDYNYGQYMAQYSFKLFSYHRLTIHSSGAYGDRPEIMGERISGKTGSMTLPADIISSDRWINGSIVYEYPLLRFSWGALTVLAFWEQGVFGGSDINPAHYYGPGCGTLLYLKKIALPAMGFNLGHNMKTGGTEFSFYVGMSI
ncbi:MAG TPA: hypothetical protein PK514_09540 [Spirochaetota bacterium]|nr:hypothetical protein [Spirochaetota bacterium]